MLLAQVAKVQRAVQHIDKGAAMSTRTKKTKGTYRRGGRAMTGDDMGLVDAIMRREAEWLPWGQVREPDMAGLVGSTSLQRAVRATPGSVGLGCGVVLSWRQAGRGGPSGAGGNGVKVYELWGEGHELGLPLQPEVKTEEGQDEAARGAGCTHDGGGPGGHTCQES